MNYPIRNIPTRQGHPIPEHAYYPGEIFDPAILREPEPVGHDGNYSPYDYDQCEDCGELYSDNEDHTCLA